MPLAIQFSSVVQWCPTLWDPWPAAHQASLFFANSQSFLKLTSIESIMPSNHLILCCLLLLSLIFSRIRVFSSESAVHIRWQKYWSFSLSISPSNEYSRLISFRIDRFDLLAAQRTFKSLLKQQFEIISSSVFSLLYGTTITYIHDNWKNHNFDYIDLCWQSYISTF